MEIKDRTYSEKTEFYKKDIEQTIEDFENNFVKDSDPLTFFEGAEEKMNISRKKLERIVKKDNLTKEEKYFINNELNLGEIFSKYHEDALKIVGHSLRFFYIFRNSESSRNLDTSVWFAKYLKVPNVKYIDKILENTPKEDLQREFDGQLEISKEDTDFLLYKYNLQPPQKVLPITKMYKEEVHSKRDLLYLLKKFGLKK